MNRFWTRGPGSWGACPVPSNRIRWFLSIVVKVHGFGWQPGALYVGATCRSSKNDMRRLKIKGRSGFQCFRRLVF